MWQHHQGQVADGQVGRREPRSDPVLHRGKVSRGMLVRLSRGGDDQELGRPVEQHAVHRIEAVQLRLLNKDDFNLLVGPSGCTFWRRRWSAAWCSPSLAC